VDYELAAKIFKALSDPKRVQIVDMLSCGEKCACDLLEYFDFTQPTLSHHMKVLMNAGIVQTRKAGTWHNYSLNEENVDLFFSIMTELLEANNHCICHKVKQKN